jgi:hypothetical protein
MPGEEELYHIIGHVLEYLLENHPWLLLFILVFAVSIYLASIIIGLLPKSRSKVDNSNPNLLRSSQPEVKRPKTAKEIKIEKRMSIILYLVLLLAIIFFIVSLYRRLAQGV